MKHAITAIATLTASVACFAPVAHADHDISRSIRHEYDLHRKELDQSYRAEREAVRCDYLRNRDLLLAELQRVIHSHCANRGDEIRGINRQLSLLSREYGRDLKNLAGAFVDRRGELRDRRDFALREARYAHSAAFAQPAAYLDPHTRCGGDCPHCHGQGSDVVYQRRREVDWTDVVVNLLAHRLSR